MTLDGSDGTDDYSKLQAFLEKADLADHFTEIYFRLRVRRIEDLKDITEADATSINMTNPQYSRLKRFLREKSGWSKLFRRDSSREKRPTSLVVPTPTPAGARYLISRDCVKFGKRLGTGEYGEVYQGEWRDVNMSRVSVAIKTMNKDKQPRNELDIRKEADAMHSVSHPNIIKLYGVVLNTTEPMMLVMELAALGNLENLLIEEGFRFPILTLYSYAEQVASGMEYLAEKQIIHRDLSTRNLLLVTRDKLKISDFGLARPLPQGKSYYEMSQPRTSKVAFGWTAPEALKTTRFTVQSDVWSFGVTLWEMFSHGACPWGELNAVQILELIEPPFMRRLDCPDHCPQDVYSLMLKCWAHDPDERPTFKALRNLITTIIPPIATVTEALVVENDPTKLTLKEGDIITVTELTNPTWWYGQCNSTGAYGTFPRKHVRLEEVAKDFGSSPPGRDHSPLSADDISNPHNPVHNFHIGSAQLVEMTESELQNLLSCKTIQPRIPGSTPGMGGPRRLSDPLANKFTVQTGSPAPALPATRPPMPLPPRMLKTMSHLTTNHRQSVGVISQMGGNTSPQALPKAESNEPPPPYTPHDQRVRGWDGQIISQPWPGTKKRSQTTSDLSDSVPNEYAHLWEARTKGSSSTQSPLISFDEPAIPYDMPNPPSPFDSQTDHNRTKTGEYATLDPIATRTHESLGQQRSTDSNDDDYLPMDSPQSTSSGSAFSDGRNSLTHSLSDPAINSLAVGYVDMNERRRLMKGIQLAKQCNPSQDESATTNDPRVARKPVPSPRSRTSSPRPVPRPRPSGSQSPQSPPIRVSSATPSVPINLPPPSTVSINENKLQQVLKSLHDTTRKEAEEILIMYEWNVQAAIQYLTIVRGAELTRYNKDYVKEVARWNDTTEAIRYLKVEKLLQFAQSAGLKQVSQKSCQTALDRSNWNCDQALHFLLEKKR